MYNKRAYHQNCKQHGSDHFKGFGKHHMKKAWGEHFGMQHQNPPANVKEKDNKYELHLFAPGFEKSDFLIALIDQNLSISVEEKKGEGGNWKRQEYIPKAFVRQFQLNDKVDRSAINAKYENGVLIVSIPKLEGFETVREEIKVG